MEFQWLSSNQTTQNEWKFPKKVRGKPSQKKSRKLNVPPLDPATWACLRLREISKEHGCIQLMHVRVRKNSTEDPNKLLESGATKLRSKTEGINPRLLAQLRRDCRCWSWYKPCDMLCHATKPSRISHMRLIEGDKFAWCKVIAIAHLVHFVAEVTPSQWGPTWPTRQCYSIIQKFDHQKAMCRCRVSAFNPNFWRSWEYACRGPITRAAVATTLRLGSNRMANIQRCAPELLASWKRIAQILQHRAWQN